VKVQIGLLLTLLLLSCSNSEVEEVSDCNNAIEITNFNTSTLIDEIPEDALQALTKAPNEEGALGRNKEGYFHVRFQLDILYLAVYALRFENKEALDQFFLASDYSFNRQLPTGDFELVVPESLQNSGVASLGDSLSANAFFLSAFGTGFSFLLRSTWFMENHFTEYEERINMLKNKLLLAGNYLYQNKTVLMEYDKNAPNRLLFDALAFYSLSSVVTQESWKQLSFELIGSVTQKQNETGFYIENDGYDSSYNGVSLKLAGILLALLPDGESIKNELSRSVYCACAWQVSRVLPSGEISTEGNERVYPGGELFLGEEKQMAWVDTFLAFQFFKNQFLNLSLENKADAIKAYYQ